MITSSQVGGIGKHASPPHTITEKITTRLQNKYHSGSSENQAIQKSDNQGFKEATFIQTGKRGRDAKTQGEVRRGAGRWRGMEMQNRWVKIRRNTSGVRDPSPRPDHPAQGSSTRKISPHNFWL